jgi:hypothetical protein
MVLKSVHVKLRTAEVSVGFFKDPEGRLSQRWGRRLLGTLGDEAVTAFLERHRTGRSFSMKSKPKWIWPGL